MEKLKGTQLKIGDIVFDSQEPTKVALIVHRINVIKETIYFKALPNQEKRYVTNPMNGYITFWLNSDSLWYMENNFEHKELKNIEKNELLKEKNKEILIRPTNLSEEDKEVIKAAVNNILKKANNEKTT